jgi:hypothetical protein
MIRRHILLTIVVLGLVASAASGRTWRVEKDGSGDFTVIQDAVDAASDGDVIAIGPGRYEEYQVIPKPNGSEFDDIYVFLEDATELTIVGAGADQTTIGPEDPGIHGFNHFSFGIASTHTDCRVTVRDLAIRNIPYNGIQINGELIVENCHFSMSVLDGSSVGVTGRWTSGATIRNCRFEGLDYGVSTVFSGGAVILIEDSEFVGCQIGIYAYTPGSRDVRVHRCRFEGWEAWGQSAGVGFLVQAGGVVRECEFINCMIIAHTPGPLTITDCVVSRNDGRRAVELITGSPLTVERNIFESNGTVIECAIYSTHTIRENHFVRTGDGYWVESRGGVNSGLPADFALNYWGTTDLEAIAAGIWDCEDDPQLVNCVLFEPVADAPVAVQSRTLSGVKRLFR